MSVNGKKITDLQSASLKQNFNAKPVPSMTQDRFNVGFVEGNTDIDIMMQAAVRNKLSRPKLDQLNYEENDIQITWVAGAEQFIATGVFRKDAEDNAGGVGDEVKITWNFGALKLVDSVGNSVLFDLALTPG